MRSDVNGRALDQLHSSPGHQTKVSLRAVGVRVRDLHNYPQVEMTRPACVDVCLKREIEKGRERVGGGKKGVRRERKERGERERERERVEKKCSRE